MHDHSLIQDVVIILCSAVLVSAALRFFRIPAILIYLFTGLLIGPTGIGLIEGENNIHLLAEFGVVFLLFTLGLEFSLPKLLKLKKLVFGLGGIQVSICFTVFFAVILLYGTPMQAAALCAIVLALSSTALVSKELTETHKLHTRVGQLSIGILLFQDLVAVLALSLIPVWALEQSSTPLEQTLTLLKAAGTLIVALLAGRWILPALFTEVAKVRSQELFILTALAVALSSAYVMQAAGLSMSLGAFIAGMLLGESHFRHQIEADIRPFRDVLLGIFFVSIGMLLDLNIVFEYWPRILFFTFCLLIFKASLIVISTVFMRENFRNGLQTGLILAQGGEFGFVLIALGQSQKIIPPDVASFTLAIVIISMMTSTLMIRHIDTLLQCCENLWLKLTKNSALAPQDTEMEGPLENKTTPRTIIAGYGRVGQTLGRFLIQESIPYCAIDDDPTRVSEAREAGENVIFGDARQHKLLLSAGLEGANQLILTFDDPEQSLEIIKHVRPHHDNLQILVRTRDNAQLEALMRAGANEVIPEVLEASLMLVSQTLLNLGVSEERVRTRLRQTRQAHYRQLHAFYGGESNFEEEERIGEIQYLHPVTIEQPSKLVGQDIASVQKMLDQMSHNTVVIEGYKHHHNPHPSPPLPSQQLTEGDTLVLRGTPDGLEHAQMKILGT